MHFDLTGELLDTFFSLAGKYGRWLNAKKKKTCFVIWTAACTYWFFRDLQLCLFSQALFCLPSIGLHIYSYYNWSKDDKQKRYSKDEVDLLINAAIMKYRAGDPSKETVKEILA